MSRDDTRCPTLRNVAEFPDSEHDRLVNEIRRFRSAASDMHHVALAAATLDELGLNEGAVRVLHTGIVITYVRPFRSEGIGSLDEEEWAPQGRDARTLHDALVSLRNKVYAHPDRTPYRDIEDASALLMLRGGPTYAESYVLLNESGVTRLGEIAVEQGRRFSSEARRREVLLGRPPDLSAAPAPIPEEEWSLRRAALDSQ